MLLQYFLVTSKMLTFKTLASWSCSNQRKKKNDFVSCWKLTRGYTEIVRALVFLQFLQRHIFVAMDHSLFAHQSIHLNNKNNSDPLNLAAVWEWNIQGEKWCIWLPTITINTAELNYTLSMIVDICWETISLDGIVSCEVGIWGMPAGSQ